MFVSLGRHNRSGHVLESIAIEITDSAPDILRPSWGLTVQHVETVEIQEGRTMILKFLLCMSTLTLGGGSAVSRNNYFPRRSDACYSPVDLKISTDATNPQCYRKPRTKFSKLDQLRRPGADSCVPFPSFALPLTCPINSKDSGVENRDVRRSMNRRFRTKSAGLNEVVSALQKNRISDLLTATKEWDLAKIADDRDRGHGFFYVFSHPRSVYFRRVCLFDGRRITEWWLSVTSVIYG